MLANLSTLPIDERIKLVEDLWDSIAQDNEALPVTKEQKVELNLRLDAYAIDKNKGRESNLVFQDIKNKL